MMGRLRGPLAGRALRRACWPMVVVAMVATGGCAGPASPPAVVALAPADRFMAALAVYCGQAFAGRVLVDAPASATPGPFAGKVLVMHVRGCEDPIHELRVPFHVGDDHSRTWVLTRTSAGVRVKHDHRHPDGSPDAMTQYGGDSRAGGTATRQEFPVDAASIALFQRLGSTASLENTWAIDIQPGRQLVYELSRPNGRLLRVAFDLTRPVALPPAPWGG